MAAGGMTIGEVAQRAGLAPSAIRYYERLGLVTPPGRTGGKRRYDEGALAQLALVAAARDAGFTLAEIQSLASATRPEEAGPLWRQMAERKLEELDELARRTDQMRQVLRVALACGCLRTSDCARLLGISPESAERGAWLGRAMNPCASPMERGAERPLARPP